MKFEKNYRRESGRDRHIRTDCLPGEELFAQRSARAKTYSLGKGMYQTVVFPEDVHYTNPETGAWEEIDNRLIEDKADAREAKAGRRLKTQAGPLAVRFGAQASASPLIEMRNAKGHTLSWTLEDARDAPAEIVREPYSDQNADEDGKRRSMRKTSGCVRYADALPEVDLVCHVHGEEFKDELILKKPLEVCNFRFALNAPGCTVQSVDGGFALWDSRDTQAPAFLLPAAFMIDAMGEIGEVAMRCEEMGGTFALTLVPDAAFLATARYPVTVDPSVKVKDSSVADTFVSNQNPTQNYASDALLRAGTHSGLGLCRAFMQVSALPDVPAACTMTKVWLSMTAPETYGTLNNTMVTLHEVGANWNAVTLNWNNQPPIGDAVDYTTVFGGETSYQSVSFDITTLARKWYANRATNYGVALCAQTDAQAATLCSAQHSDSDYTEPNFARPVLVMNYISHAGIEPAHAYEAYSLGRAGTAQVALHSGNLVFTRGLTSANGNRMPVSLGLVYNACDAAGNPFGIGYGWRLNVSQHVHRETISEEAHYVYTDGDGTRHYFTKATEVDDTGKEVDKKDADGNAYYEDQSGLSLKMYINGTSLTIVSKDHTKMAFVTPTSAAAKMIDSITDSCDNQMRFTYTGGKLTKVTDGAGRETLIAYPASPGNVMTIQPPGYAATEVARVEWDAATNLLNKVTDLDGVNTGYEYIIADKLLTRIVNSDARYMDIQYTQTAPKRVRHVNEIGPALYTWSQPTPGNNRSYEYFECVTKVKDETVTNGKTLTYQFNDWGNVVAVHDELGFASFTKYSPMGTPNTPEATSKLQKMVINRLAQPDFEAPGAWQTGSLSGLGGFAYDLTSRMGGLKSLRIQKTDLEGVSYAEQTANLPPDAYTFSAYVKSEGNIDCWLELSYLDAHGERKAVESLKMRHAEDFLRLSCTLELPADATSGLRCRVMAGSDAGSAWFDCAQLENGTVPNRYNMLQNGDFSTMPVGSEHGWTLNRQCDVDQVSIGIAEPGIPAALGPNSLKLTGRLDRNAGIYREMPCVGQAGDTYVCGGWARGQSVPTGGRATFRLRVSFLQTENNSWKDGGTADWNEEWVNWQYACAAAVAPKDYTAVRLTIEYGSNLNEAEIAAVQLVKDVYGQTYAYDEENNIISTSDLLGKHNQAKYDIANNLISYIQPGRANEDVYTMEYGGTEIDTTASETVKQKRHLVTKATTPLGMVSETVYDRYGNAKRSRASHRDAATPFIQTQTEFTANGNYASKAIDARGNAVSTVTDENKGLVRSVTDPAGQTITYTYDNANRLIEAKTIMDGRTHRNTYTYENDRLASVAYNNEENSSRDTKYQFVYDALGRQTEVNFPSLGSQALSTNHYTADGLMNKVVYGNGGAVHYTHDDFKRTSGIRYDNAEKNRFTYTYGANGATAAVKDEELGRTAKVSYDTAERPVQAELWETTERDGEAKDELRYHLIQQYDEYNQPSKLTERVHRDAEQRELYETSIVYDKESRPTEINYSAQLEGKATEAKESKVSYHPRASVVKDALYVDEEKNPHTLHAEFAAAVQTQEEALSTHKLSYTYDTLSRIRKRELSNTEGTLSLCGEYEFVDGGHGAGSSTPLVGKIAQAGRTLIYTYDNVGNITRVHEQGSKTLTPEDLGMTCQDDPVEYAKIKDQSGLQAILVERKAVTAQMVPTEIRYTYDKLGQLTRVDDQRADRTWIYEYNRGGNIFRKWSAHYTLESWPSGGMEAIDYSYAGYPYVGSYNVVLTSYNAKPITYDAIANPLSYDGWTFTWKAGRMLDRMQKAGTDIRFTYDHTGLRVKKSVNGIDTKYTLNGKTITHVQKGDTHMHIFYDAQGRPSLLRHNGVDYAYLQNLQGDVTGLIDMDGVRVVEYTYDAWGKPQETFGQLAATLGMDNPFRYRGYVWDEETGLYYLRSRYYNPEWGRFLNADAIFGKAGALLSHNVFAYALNNPENMTDSTGRAPWWEQVPASDVKSLGWRDIFVSHYGFEPGTTRKRSLLEKDGVATIIDMATGASFEVTWTQIRDDGYHIDGSFKEQEEGVALFASLLGLELPPGYSTWDFQGAHDIWDDAGGWLGRPAILVLSDGTMSTGTLVPMPHKGSPGKFNIKGHFDFYLKDNHGNGKINMKKGISYEKTYNLIAMQAYRFLQWLLFR